MRGVDHGLDVLGQTLHRDQRLDLLDLAHRALKRGVVVRLDLDVVAVDLDAVCEAVLDELLLGFERGAQFLDPIGGKGAGHNGYSLSEC